MPAITLSQKNAAVLYKARLSKKEISLLQHSAINTNRNCKKIGNLAQGLPMILNWNT